MNLGLAAIGGKGFYEEPIKISNVPLTLISFACVDGKKIKHYFPVWKFYLSISITKLKKMDCQITKNLIEVF